MRQILTNGMTCITLALLLAVTAGCPGESNKPAPNSKSTANDSAEETKSQEKPTTEKATGSGSTDESTASSEGPSEGGWGTLSGTFMYEGTPPTQESLNLTKDVQYCSKKPPLNEELVVNPENKGIQNIVIALYVNRGDEPPQAHESYAETASAKVSMDNQWCRFEPHVQFVQAGNTIAFGNEDTMGHNVNGNTIANTPFNQTVAAGSVLVKELPKPESVPFKVSCTIHPWMTGWVVVKDHPYVAISGDDGNFEIKNLPSGSWTLQVWQEKGGYMQEFKVKGKNIELSRGGRWEVDVYDEAEEGNAAKNSLGDIRVPASNFE